VRGEENVYYHRCCLLPGELERPTLAETIDEIENESKATF
jgi:hypothetical protein